MWRMTLMVLSTSLLCGCLPSAQGAQTPVSWAYRLFFLSEAARQDACRQGVAAGQAGRLTAPGPGQLNFSGEKFDPLGHTVFRSAYGSVFAYCRELGAGGQPLPTEVPNLSVSVETSGEQLAAQSAVLTFYDAADHELMRRPLFGPSAFSPSAVGPNTAAPVQGVQLSEQDFSPAEQDVMRRAPLFRLLLTDKTGLRTLVFSLPKYDHLQ